VSHASTGYVVGGGNGFFLGNPMRTPRLRHPARTPITHACTRHHRPPSTGGRLHTLVAQVGGGSAWCRQGPPLVRVMQGLPSGHARRQRSLGVLTRSSSVGSARAGAEPHRSLPRTHTRQAGPPTIAVRLQRTPLEKSVVH
jgi:hypothetical protein